MTTIYLARAALVTAGALLAANPAPALADAYPSKPIRIVVPSSPGGSADAIIRIVGERLGAALGQPVVIENKGGGGGNIATVNVAKAPADGYTVLMTGNNHTLNVSLFANPPYRLDEFVPVIELTRGPSVFVSAAAAPGSPIRTLPELVARARAQPGKLTYGSPGVGLPSHVAMEMFAQAAGIRLAHAPYKGAGPSLTDVMGGQIPLVTATLAAAMPHFKAGRIVPLAVTSEQRWPGLPDVPTVAESGYPGYAHMTWLGLLVPKGTPTAVVARLNAETAKVLAEPQIRARLDALGTTAVGGSAQAFGKMLADEATAARDLVRSAGLRAGR